VNSDTRISRVETLRSAESVLRELPSTPPVTDLVYETRCSIHRMLTGEDSRLLAIVGPCSVHDPDAAIEYARWLGGKRRSLTEHLLMVMRVYFEKPRTHLGWKGLINDPYLDGSCRINEGMYLARKLLLDINKLGIPTATEFVDLVTPQYIADLISWSAIGARTSESQIHRQLASGLSCPVGFKNGTTGSVDVAVNAVLTARHPHSFLSVTKSGTAAIISTTGNADCHVILRGGRRPNYDAASVESAEALLESRKLPRKILIDCSHANCQKESGGQLAVAEEVRRQIQNGSKSIFGLMVESNLIAGKQNLAPGRPLVFGQSITDACIGLDDTSRLLSIAAGQASPRLVPRSAAAVS
jgi:3-deoxy-7-phosphoheptulonate synthase